MAALFEPGAEATAALRAAAAAFHGTLRNRQTGTLSDRGGRDTQQFLQIVATALGTFRLLAPSHQKFEFLVAAATTVFVDGHVGGLGRWILIL
jgi:nitrate/nitrite transporter NarK